MKERQFTEVQKMRILREADVERAAAMSKRHGVSAQTIYDWYKRYGTLEVSGVRRLPDFEAGNAPLKRIVAERAMELDVRR